MSFGRGLPPFLLLAGALSSCSPQVRPAGHTRAPQTSAAPQKVSPPSTPTDSVAAPSSPSPPEAVPAPLAPVDRRGLESFGTNAAIALEAASTTGQWVAYCQPRVAEGPATMPVDPRGSPALPVELTLGTQAGRFPISRLLAVDPSGRFIIVKQEEQVLLWDTTSGSRHSLSALAPDLEDDGLPEHRSFAFSRSGQSLVVLTRSAEGQSSAVLLDLTQDDPPASRRLIDTGGGLIWRVTAEGETFVFAMLAGGVFPARSRERSLRCENRAFDGYPRISGPLADPAVSYRLLPPNRKNLTVSDAPGFVLAMTDGWVRRTEEGRLLWVQGGSQRQIASSRCGGRILHADAMSGLFLVSCERYLPVRETEAQRQKKKNQKPEYRFDLYLLRPGLVRDLDHDMMRTGVDLKASWQPRLVPLRPGADQALVDFAHRTIIDLAPAEFVLVTDDRAALLRKGESLLLLRDGRREELPLKVTPLTPVITRDAVAAVGARVFFLRRGELSTWTLERDPIALTPVGTSFVPRVPGGPAQWPMGPLTQVFPEEPQDAPKGSP